LAEDIHQKILIRLGEQEESVHLCSWPCADEDMIHPEIEKNMVYAQKIIEIANSIRQENKIKLRWPLNSIVVEGKEMRDVVQMFGSVIKNMCNVKNVRFGIVSGDKEIEGIKVFVDTQITHELKKEAFVRELIRKIQELRKSMKLVVSDRVELFLDCDKAELSGFENDMKKEVGAKKVSFGKIGNVGKDKTIFEFEDRTIEIGIKKEK
jgi:valyl-tRNA synthetase